MEDVAAAIALAVTTPGAASRVYNVAEPTAYTEAEWVAKIGTAVGWNGKVVAVPDEKMPAPFNTAQDLSVDTTRIRAELGYREVIDSEEGLRKTVEWEQEHLPELQLDYSAEDKLLVDHVSL
jgi:nucleoside-diphosphate-sugar epimerase